MFPPSGLKNILCYSSENSLYNLDRTSSDDGLCWYANKMTQLYWKASILATYYRFFAIAGDPICNFVRSKPRSI